MFFAEILFFFSLIQSNNVIGLITFLWFNTGINVLNISIYIKSLNSLKL